jgi:outer membrane protein
MRCRLFATLFGASLLLPAQEPKRLTLREAEDIALKTHPAVTAARYSAVAAAEVPMQVSAAHYPVVGGNFTAAGAPENTRLAAGAINNPVIYSRLASGVSVSQLLLDFGRTSHLVESSKARAAAEEESANAVRSQVVLDVDRAFFTALRSEAILRVANETVRARQLVVDQVTELERARLKSGLDTSFANIGLQEAKLLLATAQNERQASYASLAAALGFQSQQSFELAEEGFNIEPLSLSELIAKAVRERPDLKARRLDVDSATQLTRAERALKFPSISAVASAGVIPQHVDALRGQYGAVGLNVNLPFLNGGLYRARESEARLRTQAAGERVKDLETRVVRDVTLALLSVNNAAERVDLTRTLLEHSSQALELAQARYDLGLSSIVELSQAQLARTSAALQNTNAKYDYQIQRAVLDYQVGRR